MKKIKLTTVLVVLIVSAMELTGCASPGKGMLPQDTGQTMVGVYQQETQTGGYDQSVGSEPLRETVSNPYTKVAIQKVVNVHETVSDAGEYYKPVENLRMRIFVYPHRVYNAENEESIVPGYYTYYPLYSHQHYYLPGEAY